jgi:hypothetical protein
MTSHLTVICWVLWPCFRIPFSSRPSPFCALCRTSFTRTPLSLESRFSASHSFRYRMYHKKLTLFLYHKMMLIYKFWIRLHLSCKTSFVFMLYSFILLTRGRCDPNLKALSWGLILAWAWRRQRNFHFSIYLLLFVLLYFFCPSSFISLFSHFSFLLYFFFFFLLFHPPFSRTGGADWCTGYANYSDWEIAVFFSVFPARAKRILTYVATASSKSLCARYTLMSSQLIPRFKTSAVRRKSLYV